MRKMLIGLSALAWLSGSLTAAAEQEIHIVHCLHGCPAGAPSDNDLVVREIFTLSSNDRRKFADWVAYRVTRSTIGTSKDLNRGWGSDPSLADEETLEPPDYKGASKALDIDRGHQAPLATFANTVYWRDTNLLSNITPQSKDLNQGPWRHLEEAVRDAAYRLREVFVITGPLYERPMAPLPEADEEHAVPSGYWKIVATRAGAVAGFIMDQKTARDLSFCDATLAAAISDIESRARLKLFPHAPTNWGRDDLRDGLGC